MLKIYSVFLFPLSIFQLPTDPEELRQWMYRLYFEKEKLLEDFYRTGAFPRSGAASSSTKGTNTTIPVLGNQESFCTIQ